MNAAEILHRARGRIATHETWTKGASARNLSGRDVSGDDKEAVCWCAMGALWADGPSSSLIGAPFLRASVDDGNVAAFNDAAGTTHTDVLAVYDRAIALAEAA